MTYSQVYKNYEIKPRVVTDLGISESGVRRRHGRILGEYIYLFAVRVDNKLHIVNIAIKVYAYCAIHYYTMKGKGAGH